MDKAKTDTERIADLEREFKNLAKMTSKALSILTEGQKREHSVLVGVVEMVTGRRPAARSGKVTN